MKILLLGKNELLLQSIIRLSKIKSYELFVALPNKKAKSRFKFKNFLIKKKIKYFFDKNKYSLNNLIKRIKPNIILSCGYNRIIHNEILQKIKCPINIHFGNLPKLIWPMMACQ